MRLVQESPESSDVAAGLASSARAAIGADAVLIARTGAAVSAPLLGSSGLSSGEERQVLQALAARQAGVAVIGVPGFARTLVAESAIAGPRGAVLCALQRRRRGFECPSLAGVFAHHAVLASAGRRGPRLVDPTIASLDEPLLEQASDYVELNRAITRLLRRLVGAERAGVFLWSEQEEALVPVPGALGNDPSEELPAHAPDDWTSSVARAFVTGHSYLSNRALDDAGVRTDYAVRFAMRRVLTVPIAVSGRRIGVLQVVNKPKDFTIRDMHSAERIASVLASPVQATELRFRLRKARELERIFTSTAIEIACGRAPFTSRRDEPVRPDARPRTPRSSWTGRPRPSSRSCAPVASASTRTTATSSPVWLSWSRWRGPASPTSAGWPMQPVSPSVSGLPTNSTTRSPSCCSPRASVSIWLSRPRGSRPRPTPRSAASGSSS